VIEQPPQALINLASVEVRPKFRFGRGLRARYELLDPSVPVILSLAREQPLQDRLVNPVHVVIIGPIVTIALAASADECKRRVARDRPAGRAAGKGRDQRLGRSAERLPGSGSL
jgi:hypothetical protein